MRTIFSSENIRVMVGEPVDEKNNYSLQIESCGVSIFIPKAEIRKVANAMLATAPAVSPDVCSFGREGGCGGKVVDGLCLICGEPQSLNSSIPAELTMRGG